METFFLFVGFILGAASMLLFLKMVVIERDRAKREREEAVTMNWDLLQENEALKAKVAKLEARARERAFVGEFGK